MKSKALILLIFVYFVGSFLFRCGAQIITVPEDDINTQFGVFVDPTFTDAGAQFGVFAVMVMNWGYVGASFSNYNNLNGVGYSDLVGSMGLNRHLFEFEPLRYYGGFRIGTLWRGAGNGFPLVGGELGADWRITRGFYLGVKLWTDYREDQKNTAFGDSGAYKRGLVTNNPLLQENGALTLSVSF